jgi:hypothetical protein
VGLCTEAQRTSQSSAMRPGMRADAGHRLRPDLFGDPSTLQPANPLRDCRPEKLPHEALGLRKRVSSRGAGRGRDCILFSPPGAVLAAGGGWTPKGVARRSAHLRTRAGWAQMATIALRLAQVVGTATVRARSLCVCPPQERSHVRRSTRRLPHRRVLC